MLAVFDWDGTLMDSTRKIVVCMQRAAKDGGLPALDDPVIENIIGLGLPEAIESLYPGLPAAKADHLRVRYAEYFVNLDRTPMPLFDGVVEGLQALRTQGVRLAVATGKSRKGLDRILGMLDLQHLFDVTRCADETASKPNPKMLQELLAVTAMGVERAVMVGDTEYDMAMAKAIAMPRIAVDYGAHHIDRLKPYEPVLCAGHFSDVTHWILQNLTARPLLRS